MKHARKDYDRIQDPAGLIPEDEPVFLIRGQDIVGPTAVRTWAHIAELLGASDEIVTHALEHADQMDRWQEEHGRKMPDMP